MRLLAVNSLPFTHADEHVRRPILRMGVAFNPYVGEEGCDLERREERGWFTQQSLPRSRPSDSSVGRVELSDNNNAAGPQRASDLSRHIGLPREVVERVDNDDPIER